MKKQRQRLVSLLLTICIVLTMLPVMAMAAAVGGTVEYIKDTDSWYSDATKEFMTRETYWNNDVTEKPADYSVDESTETVSIGSPEALVWWAQRVNAGESFAGYTVNITADLDLSAHYWTPICTGTVSYSDDGKYDIAGNQTLDGTTINGNGHTIIGLATQTGVRGPNQDSKPGDGQNCYYDAAFIGYSCCDITIEDLTFDGARIAISEPFDKVVNTYGSSMLAVVVGAQSGGSLTLKNVTVNDADVLAMQKASAFVGNLMGGSTLTVEQCAITNSRFSAYFMVAPIAAYGTSAQVTVNGIKLENNTIRMVDQSWPDGYFQDPDSEAWYINEGSGYDLNASATAVFNDGTSTINGTSVNGTEWTPVAEVNGYQYGSLAAAIDAVPDGVETTVKLTADFQLDATVTIPEGKIVVLDLNGKTVTESGTGVRKICNNGQLTILSSAAGGTLKNEDVGSYGLIDNYGTLKIQSGNFENYGRASGAAIKNRPGAALLEISGGVFSGLVEDPDGNQNNYATSANVLVASEAPLVVTGGTFSSRAHYSAVFKIFSDNADISNATVSTYMAGGIEVAGGNAVLTDCEFHVSAENSYYANAVAVSNGGTATIDGGTYTGYKYATYVYNSGGTINISGGKFDAATVLKADPSTYEQQPSVINVSGGAFTGSFGIANGATLSITGGYFSADPSNYVAEGQGLAAVEGSYVQDGVSYAYQVTTAPVENVEVKPGATETTVPSAGELGITDEQKTDLDTAVSGITGSGLSSAGNTVASDEEKLPTADQALSNFKKQLPEEATTAAGASKVTVVIAPRLEVTVETYKPDESKLTLDIKAVYDLKATTDSSDMKEEGDEGVPNAEVNTVTLEKNAGTLDTTGTQVQVSIPLPAGFVGSTSESIFVTHVKDNGAKYIHKATVSDNGGGGFTASFLNSNGFSSFTLTTDTAASITDAGTTTYYETLQEAANAALNNQTIKLEKDCAESVVVSKAVSFTLDKNDKAFTGSIAAGSGYSMTKDEDTQTYTFTYVGGGSSDGSSPGGGGGSSTPTYSVSAPSSVSNGSISVSPKNAAKGSTVTITVKPDDGYVLDTLTVKDASNNTVELTKKSATEYTFKMPASKVTISASFTEETAESVNPFTDIKSSDYYYDAVLWAVENGITTGLTATKFGPDQAVSRAQMVTFLWRAAGSPKATASNPFTDVKSSDYYYDAVQWAVANGVTTGTSATTFSPEAPVSRAQAVTFQWRAAGSPEASANSFSDVSADEYYANAVAWAVANEITNGVTATKFGPDVTVSRAQAVTFLYRETN